MYPDYVATYDTRSSSQSHSLKNPKDEDIVTQSSHSKCLSHEFCDI